MEIPWDAVVKGVLCSRGSLHTLQTPPSDLSTVAPGSIGEGGDIKITTAALEVLYGAALFSDNQSATELPVALGAPDVVQSCREAYVQTGSEFVVTGRGGLPQGPLDPAITTLWQDALPIEGDAQAVPEVTVPEMTEAEAEGDPATDSDVTTPPPIVEIQGWIKGEYGQIVLVADNPQQSTVGQLVACQG